MIITILTFLIIIGILVFVHEFGHFIVAKKSGMKVEEFGFGFPPRLVGWQKIGKKFKWVWGHKRPHDTEQTVYSINAIPLGGFVKIYGENNEGEGDHRSFVSKGFWRKFLTLVAGVVMNWLLAAVILSLVAGLGTTTELSDSLPGSAKISNRQVAISEVLPGTPADKAGLMAADIILQIDGHGFQNSEDARNYIIANKGKAFTFEIQRISEDKTLIVQSNPSPGPDQGPTGIALTDIAKVQLPWPQAVLSGFSETFYTTGAIFSQVALLFHSRQALNEVGGPVAIGKLVGQVRELGIVPLMRLTALLSLSLAALNILPFPALDGGRILFLIIEKVRRKRNNQQVEQWVNTVGFVFLILLMVVVTIKDIVQK